MLFALKPQISGRLRNTSELQNYLQPNRVPGQPMNAIELGAQATWESHNLQFGRRIEELSVISADSTLSMVEILTFSI